MLELAQALGRTSNAVAEIIPFYEKIGRQDAEQSADAAMLQHAAILKNKAALKKAVSDGLITQGGNPWFMTALQEKVAVRETEAHLKDIFTKYQSGESRVTGKDGKPLYVSDDFDALDTYLNESIKPLTSGRNATEVQAMAPVVEDFKRRTISAHLSRRSQEREVQGRSEFTASIRDLTTSALLGTDSLAPLKLQKALDQEVQVTPGGIANGQTLRAMLDTFREIGPAVGGDPETFEQLASSVKTSPGNSLATAPGFKAILEEYRVQYAEHVALRGRREEQAKEDAVKAAGLGTFLQLRKQFPPGTPLDQMKIPLGQIQKASPEIFEDILNRLQVSEGNYNTLSGLSDKSKVRDNIKTIVEKRADGETWVNLQALIDDTMIRGGGSEIRGLMDVDRDTQSTTNPDDWFNIRMTHMAGKLDAKAVARFRPLVGRDRIEQFMDMVDPLSPENRKVDGVTLLSKVSDRHLLRLTQASDARYVYNELAAPGQTDDDDLVPEERKSEAQKFSLMLSDQMADFIKQNPQATPDEVDDHAEKVVDKIIKGFNLPTVQRVEQLRQQRQAQRQQLESSLGAPTKSALKTPAQDLESRANSVDSVLRYFASSGSDLSKVLAAKTVFDGQVPSTYDPMDDKVSFGQTAWNTAVVGTMTLPEKFTWGSWSLAINRKSNTLQYQTPPDPTHDWLVAFNRFGDTTTNPAVDKSWVNAMSRREQLRKEIHEGNYQAQAEAVVKRVQERARLEGTAGTLSPTLEEKTLLIQINNSIAEYRLLTSLAGITINEAKQGGEAVYNTLPMFSTYGDLHKRGAEVARQLNLTPEQARVFARTQAALIETRNFVIRSKLGFFGPTQNPGQTVK